MSSTSDIAERRTWRQDVALFFTFWDTRFEDYDRRNVYKSLFRDFAAALVVALVAIPLGIGFSISSGMRPEQGIIAGAVAGILGGLFGGSKYQVYGPTAAFIPVISSIVHKHGEDGLIVASVCAGIIICAMGFLRLGKFFKYVPYSIIVGFTIGIAFTIAISQSPYILGETEHVGHHAIEKLSNLPDMFVDAHAHAMLLALFTFVFVKHVGKISVYIPAALIAMAACTFVANNVWHDHLIPVVSSQYGDIGGRLLRLTMPDLSKVQWLSLAGPILAITFVGSLESLLSSRMADRLAKNPTPYNPNKELFGQGIVNSIVPLFNGFPCTGALARTATNIKLGAVSPMASIFKGLSVIVMMEFFASYLSSVPMAYVGGLLIYVASNMVKREEVATVLALGKLHIFLMFYTAVMTVATDLSMAVASALVIFLVVKYVFKVDTSYDLPSHHGPVKTEKEKEQEEPVVAPIVASEATEVAGKPTDEDAAKPTEPPSIEAPEETKVASAGAAKVAAQATEASTNPEAECSQCGQNLPGAGSTTQ